MARYRGPSDASVAIGGILSGLATIERGYRADARDKDKFRQELILQDRKTNYLGEQARADRELRKFEFQWKTLTDDKKYALDKLEALNAERADLALSDAEWKSFNYFEQTGDFQDIASAYTNSNDEKVDNALFSYTDTDKQIESLMSNVEMINTNVRISRELNRRISSMSSELGAQLPEFYEQYRDFTPADADITDKERMKRAFTVDDAEMAKIYESLAAERPDMFGDIKDNEVLQDLIRREISTQYSPAIQRASELQTMQDQATNQKIAEESAVSGDYATLQQALLTGSNLALEQVASIWQHRIFAPGEEGIQDAGKAIESLLTDLVDIGLSNVQAKAISELIVDTPANQYTKIGPLMASVFTTLQNVDGKATTGEIATAQAIEVAMEKNNVYGYMDDEAKSTFTTQLGIFYSQRDLLQKAVAAQGEYLISKLGIGDPKTKEKPINTDAAIAFINENAVKTISEQDAIEKHRRNLEIIEQNKEEDWTFDEQSETTVGDSVSADSLIIDSLDVIAGNEVPLLNDNEVPSDFTHLPMWGEAIPPSFMQNYDFGGYSKPGMFGIGGGEPMWIDKLTGKVSALPSEMSSFKGEPGDRQLYQAYEMQLQSEYSGASDYRDNLADLAEATAKVEQVKGGFKEGHPRREQRLAQLQSEISQIQESLNMMEITSPQYLDMKYYEGQ